MKKMIEKICAVFSMIFLCLILSAPATELNKSDMIIKNHVNLLQNNEGDYSIVFHCNNQIVDQIDGVAYIPEELPEMSGYDNYIFDGWYIDDSYTNRAIPGYKLSSNTDLYAKYIYTFTLVFNYDKDYVGDKLENVIAYDYIPYNLFKQNSKDYCFAGFYADSNYETTIEEGTSYSDLLSYIDESYCINIYVKLLYQHIHSYSTQTIDYESGMYNLVRQCDKCGYTYKEKQKSIELDTEEFKNNPTFDNFEKLKEQSIQALRNSVMGLNDGAITLITDNYVDLLSEIELSNIAYKELIDLYFIALSEIRVETDRQQFIYILDDEYNKINSSNQYTKETMENLQTVYDDINKNVEALEDISLLSLYNQKWNKVKDDLLLRYVHSDDRLITLYSDEGFTQGTKLIVSEIEEDRSVDGYIYLTTYKLSIVNEENIVDIPKAVRISIVFENQTSFWKVKAMDIDGNVSKANIDGNVIIINDVSSDTISLFYKEPYSIKPFIIMGISIAGVLICLLIYFIIKGRLSYDN